MKETGGHGGQSRAGLHELNHETGERHGREKQKIKICITWEYNGLYVEKYPIFEVYGVYLEIGSVHLELPMKITSR